MTLLQAARVLVRPRYHFNWIRGRDTTEGFVWYLRGTNFPPTHEDWLRSLVQPFDGELFVDVGAHIGTWAVRATRSFRAVVAFEPNVEANRILRTTVKMNGLNNISVYGVALSNISSERIVSTRNWMPRKRAEFRVPVRTLDSFKLKPSLLKIDTEGDDLYFSRPSQPAQARQICSRLLIRSLRSNLVWHKRANREAGTVQWSFLDGSVGLDRRRLSWIRSPSFGPIRLFRLRSNWNLPIASGTLEREHQLADHVSAD